MENYDQMIADISDCDDKNLVHPQRVFELYSYTRTQTSLTEAGVAEDGSLRTYTINVTRSDKKSNNNLEDIIIEEGDLDPDFDPDKTTD